MSMPWFRLYSEFAGDPVIQSLAFEDQRHFVVLLCLKCDGTLDRPIDQKIRERIICRGLGLDPVAAAEAKRRLVEVGLIEKNWQPIGWERRQFKSDVSTDRVRKYRKDKESCNVSETLRNSFGNGPDTDTDTDKDIEVTNVTLSRDGHHEDTGIARVDGCKKPSLNHQMVIDAYHEELPSLPITVPGRWPGSQGERDLRARWAESTKHQTETFWRRFFTAVGSNPHWLGDNERRWRADLRWLVKRDNFDKVIQRMVEASHV